MTDHVERVPVKRTAKLYIGGKFPRSESGHAYEVHAHDGRPFGWVAKASRKDLRDAVVAARAAQPGWAARAATTASRKSLRDAFATHPSGLPSWACTSYA